MKHFDVIEAYCGEHLIGTEVIIIANEGDTRAVSEDCTTLDLAQKLMNDGWKLIGVGIAVSTDRACMIRLNKGASKC